MNFMPPGEHLDGTTAECAHLHLLLACFRASPPPMRLPEVTGHRLPEILGTGIIDPEVFRTGYAISPGAGSSRVLTRAASSQLASSAPYSTADVIPAARVKTWSPASRQ